MAPMSDLAPTTPPQLRGRPFVPGIATNPAGRPPGDTAPRRARRIVENSASAVARTVVKAALGGDLQAAEIVLRFALQPTAPQAAA